MRLNSLGHKILTISATAFLLAACSKSNEPSTTVPVEDDYNNSTTMDNGQPDSVTTDTVESTELMDPYGTATQMGFNAFVGSDRVFFEYDSAELTSYARSVLAKQADFLEHFSMLSVVVEGHCDERGTRDYNLALGERRATAVKNYLMALGVSGNRIETISYGKERPVAVGNSDSAWSQNRRGVTLVKG